MSDKACLVRSLQTYKNSYKMGAEFKNRKLIRLQTWDYSWNGDYFITINTKNRKPYFGRIVNGQMVLTEIGELAQKFWDEIPAHFEHVKLGKFVVMPNHVHGIITIKKPNNEGSFRPQKIEEEIDIEGEIRKTIGQSRCHNQGKNTISSIVGSYKSVVSKNAHYSLPEFAWQPKFWDKIIWDDGMYLNIHNYIHNNPKNWKGDVFYL